MADHCSVYVVCFVRRDTNGHAQTTMLSSIVETLSKPVQPPAVTQFQLEQYLLARIPPLPSPSTPELWTAEEKRLRKHILEDVAFHGWPTSGSSPRHIRRSRNH